MISKAQTTFVTNRSCICCYGAQPVPCCLIKLLHASGVPALWAILFQACNTFFWCIPSFGWCIGKWQICRGKINNPGYVAGYACSKNIPTVFNSKHLTTLENVGTRTLHCKWWRLVILSATWRQCYTKHIYVENLCLRSNPPPPHPTKDHRQR